MKKLLTFALACTVFHASSALADDSKNAIADTPPAVAATPATPAAPATPAPAPAKAATPAAQAAPKTSAPAADATTATPASTATHSHHHDDAADDGSKHHHKHDDATTPTTGTSTTGSSSIPTGNATTPVVDNHGHIRYICGTPVIDEHHNLIGSSSNCNSSGNTTIVGDSAPAIISNGVWTFPPGRTYQDANGQWRVCDGDLVIDTKIGVTTCKSLSAQSNVTITIGNAQDAPQPAPMPAAPAYSGALHSDSKVPLRSDMDILGK